jgi:hypothetical protein
MSSISAGTTTTTGYEVSSDTTGALVLKTGASGTTALTIDTSQNVGIGTGSPSARLHVVSGFAPSSGGSVAKISTDSGNTATLNFYAYGSTYSGGSDFGLGANGINMNAPAGFAVASGGANPLVFATNTTTERARITSAGNFGVGTTSPTVKIQAVGAGEDQAEIQVQNTSTSANSRALFRVKSASATYGGGLMMSNATDAYPTSSLLLYNFDALPLVFGTSNTERARIDSSGNFTLGFSASPYNSAKMEIYRASAGDALILTSPVGTGNSNALAWSNSRGDVVSARIYNVDDGAYGAAIAFANRTGTGTATTERMRITSGGNVGIGTASPAYKFVVQDSAGETLSSIKNTSTNGKDYTLISGGASGSFSGGRFGLYSITDATELLAATSNTGSTAGGTTGKGVGFANAGFWIDRGWADYPSMTVCSTNFVGNTNQSQIRMHGTNATWASYPSAAGSDFACSFYIDGTYQTSSDRRFKTNITTIDGALEKVMSMTGKRYQTLARNGDIETGATQSSYKYGFIAQELQDAGLDELYKHYADEDDFTEGYNKAYSVEYDAVVPLLVNAIKEQQALIESLTQRIAALEGTS